ncbi:hypothetical protein GW17_00007734 [Ensete ventricosum]|nr:hypothetical protein GW17_00007734 [Ensete ventricosum]
MYPSKADPYYPPPSQPTGSYYPTAPPTTGVPVTLAPGVFHIQAPVAGPWSTGLCDCCDDVGNCNQSIPPAASLASALVSPLAKSRRSSTKDPPVSIFFILCNRGIRPSWLSEAMDCDIRVACGVSGALYALIASSTFCPCFYSCFYRSKLRRQYGLREEPCADCLVHCCCCESCSLCQMYRELKRRGFDMSIGSTATLSLSLSLDTSLVLPVDYFHRSSKLSRSLSSCVLL